ncbi:MAG: hypothetical protein PHE58_03460, partial [Candidatus Omnitrophica bacterium]|nr:hypothetical protein [Candidatus Omnitrophota bacterium]
MAYITDTTGHTAMIAVIGDEKGAVVTAYPVFGAGVTFWKGFVSSSAQVKTLFNEIGGIWNKNINGAAQAVHVPLEIFARAFNGSFLSGLESLERVQIIVLALTQGMPIDSGEGIILTLRFAVPYLQWKEKICGASLNSEKGREPKEVFLSIRVDKTTLVVQEINEFIEKDNSVSAVKSSESLSETVPVSSEPVPQVLKEAQKDAAQVDVRSWDSVKNELKRIGVTQGSIAVIRPFFKSNHPGDIIGFRKATAAHHDAVKEMYGYLREIDIWVDVDLLIPVLDHILASDSVLAKIEIRTRVSSAGEPKPAAGIVPALVQIKQSEEELQRVSIEAELRALAGAGADMSLWKEEINTLAAMRAEQRVGIFAGLKRAGTVDSLRTNLRDMLLKEILTGTLKPYEKIQALRDSIINRRIGVMSLRGHEEMTGILSVYWVSLIDCIGDDFSLFNTAAGGDAVEIINDLMNLNNGRINPKNILEFFSIVDTIPSAAKHVIIKRIKEFLARTPKLNADTKKSVVYYPLGGNEYEIIFVSSELKEKTRRKIIDEFNRESENKSGIHIRFTWVSPGQFTDAHPAFSGGTEIVLGMYGADALDKKSHFAGIIRDENRLEIMRRVLRDSGFEENEASETARPLAAAQSETKSEQAVPESLVQTSEGTTEDHSQVLTISDLVTIDIPGVSVASDHTSSDQESLVIDTLARKRIPLNYYPALRAYMLIPRGAAHIAAIILEEGIRPILLNDFISLQSAKSHPYLSWRDAGEHLLGFNFKTVMEVMYPENVGEGVEGLPEDNDPFYAEFLRQLNIRGLEINTMAEYTAFCLALVTTFIKKDNQQAGEDTVVCLSNLELAAGISRATGENFFIIIDTYFNVAQKLYIDPHNGETRLSGPLVLLPGRKHIEALDKEFKSLVYLSPVSPWHRDYDEKIDAALVLKRFSRGHIWELAQLGLSPVNIVRLANTQGLDLQNVINVLKEFKLSADYGHLKEYVLSEIIFRSNSRGCSFERISTTNNFYSNQDYVYVDTKEFFEGLFRELVASGILSEDTRGARWDKNALRMTGEAAFDPEKQSVVVHAWYSSHHSMVNFILGLTNNWKEWFNGLPESEKGRLFVRNPGIFNFDMWVNRARNIPVRIRNWEIEDLVRTVSNNQNQPWARIAGLNQSLEAYEKLTRAFIDAFTTGQDVTVSLPEAENPANRVLTIKRSDLMLFSFSKSHGLVYYMFFNRKFKLSLTMDSRGRLMYLGRDFPVEVSPKKDVMVLIDGARLNDSYMWGTTNIVEAQMIGGGKFKFFFNPVRLVSSEETGNPEPPVESKQPLTYKDKMEAAMHNIPVSLVADKHMGKKQPGKARGRYDGGNHSGAVAGASRYNAGIETVRMRNRFFIRDNATGRIIKTTRELSAGDIVKLTNHTLEGVPLDFDGNLNIGSTTVRTFSSFPNALVNVVFKAGQPPVVIFMKDEYGNDLLDARGQQLTYVLDGVKHRIFTPAEVVIPPELFKQTLFEYNGIMRDVIHALGINERQLYVMLNTDKEYWNILESYFNGGVQVRPDDTLIARYVIKAKASLRLAWVMMLLDNRVTKFNSFKTWAGRLRERDPEFAGQEISAGLNEDVVKEAVKKAQYDIPSAVKILEKKGFFDVKVRYLSRRVNIICSRSPDSEFAKAYQRSKENRKKTAINTIRKEKTKQKPSVSQTVPPVAVDHLVETKIEQLIRDDQLLILVREFKILEQTYNDKEHFRMMIPRIQDTLIYGMQRWERVGRFLQVKEMAGLFAEAFPSDAGKLKALQIYREIRDGAKKQDGGLKTADAIMRDTRLQFILMGLAPPAGMYGVTKFLPRYASSLDPQAYGIVSAVIIMVSVILFFAGYRLLEQYTQRNRLENTALPLGALVFFCYLFINAASSAIGNLANASIVIAAMTESGRVIIDPLLLAYIIKGFVNIGFSYTFFRLFSGIFTQVKIISFQGTEYRLIGVMHAFFYNRNLAEKESKEADILIHEGVRGDVAASSLMMKYTALVIKIISYILAKIKPSSQAAGGQVAHIADSHSRGAQVWNIDVYAKKSMVDFDLLKNVFRGEHYTAAIDFCNLVWATKLLYLGEEYKKEGKTILMIMGGGHLDGLERYMTDTLARQKAWKEFS